MSDFIDQVTAIRTRLRELRDACDMGAVRYLEVSHDIVEAIRTLSPVSIGYPPAAGDPDLPAPQLLADLRAARDELEALVLANPDPAVLLHLTGATFCVARAVVTLVRKIAQDEFRNATVRRLQAGADAPIGRIIATSELGR